MNITPAVAAGGRRRRLALIAILFFTGVSAVVSGALLVAAPDGSLLQADPSAFADTPFGDWRVPGLLLAILVGGGYLATGVWQWRRLPWARGLAIFAGAGLVVFELAELAFIGFHPLEAIFAAVGIAVVALAAWPSAR